MRKAIEDEFTHLNVSRQRKYQMRMSRDQKCTECGAPVDADQGLQHPRKHGGRDVLGARGLEAAHGGAETPRSRLEWSSNLQSVTTQTEQWTASA